MDRYVCMYVCIFKDEDAENKPLTQRDSKSQSKL